LLEVVNWKYLDLQNWLKNPSIQEGWDYDFKLRIPDSRDSRGKDRIRHIFCSFANYKGGLIFFGISDDKLIIGLPYNYNFQTKISDIVGRGIFPPIRNWSLFHTIRTFNKKKYVYIVQVNESFYTDKPHMTGCLVYIRENGRCKPIENGLELRRIFLLEDNFYPEYIKPVQEILKKIKQSTDAHLSLLDTVILQKLRSYLESKCTDEARMYDFLPLLNLFKKIEALLPIIRKSLETSITEGNREYLNNHRELSNTVDEFLDELSRKL